ncbi:hypothetical protein AWH62_12015 [Maricaulis sp. W15]|jgi:uncharacterized protein (DUF302 family)|uniref:DUF302 domain-containing protein n=2 Tax=Maricaulis maris TaxID=74318 RepID=Q0AM66_MARMM|nr:protein of unknown function DUF302 [Maricaulis maris MCS10]MAC88549.1 DUF302 domain-containing protein [Maricaulis sp.]OLF71854.1 hypothetical protein AWH62_12015 [Maricaulis sp. W15]RKQ94270.1 uncharacterized protein (DUF302 family) [Maricaulis maris]
MPYTHNRLFENANMAEIEERTRRSLAEAGFGVLTEIDVKATMKAKIDVDLQAYRILGACNPTMAHRAIELEPRIGAMLPCNVILREVENGIEVSAIDPVASMLATENDDLTRLAIEVRDLLVHAIDEV